LLIAALDYKELQNVILFVNKLISYSNKYEINNNNKMYTFQQLVIFNGLYDILCVFSILKIINIPILDKLHLSMFIDEPTEQEKRWIAYWIFTYGCMRISLLNKYLISISYLIESIVIINECFIHKQIKIYNGIIVSTLSLFIAILVLL
jgi:hypothetical protein